MVINIKQKINLYCTRATFFSERVKNVWNSLPVSVDFDSVAKFKKSIHENDLSKFLRCS